MSKTWKIGSEGVLTILPGFRDTNAYRTYNDIP